MNSVLYLGVTGIVFAQIRRSKSRAPMIAVAADSELITGIAAAVTAASVVVVLNDWAVVDVGYRQILTLLPATLASRTIGATIPGNRLHRNPQDRRSRVDILRADIRRREPERLTIVDASSGAVPFEYRSRSIIIERGRQTSATQVVGDITRLLRTDITDHHAPGA
ncbi:hypothetical protein [Paraburkholderia graminis]|uniref:hypothetical protein n=1 Tax=Paraburkholderia graminis TaxID=60548 RepID=UPI000685E1C1|nr:hypothetical protein [Paraburkholderia graminis]MDQ0627147.1 hypothetical protein [Paraburkholderia graminis]